MALLLSSKVHVPTKPLKVSGVNEKPKSRHGTVFLLALSR